MRHVVEGGFGLIFTTWSSLTCFRCTVYGRSCILPPSKCRRSRLNLNQTRVWFRKWNIGPSFRTARHQQIVWIFTVCITQARPLKMLRQCIHNSRGVFSRDWDRSRWETGFCSGSAISLNVACCTTALQHNTVMQAHGLSRTCYPLELHLCALILQRLQLCVRVGENYLGILVQREDG